MTMGVFTLRRFALLLFAAVCLSLGFGAAPAAAGCGYCGGYAPAPVVVQPYVSSCSCCGCGASYGYYGYQGYGYPGYGYGAYGAYAAGYDAVVVAPYYRGYRRGCGSRWC